MTTVAETGVERLLDAVASRDVRRLAAVLAPEVTWQNVPHAPAIGRPAVLALLGHVMTWSDDVRWDVVSAAYDDRRGWVERVDRFTIDGEEHAARCNGVFDVDADGRLASVRDYVDLGEWRQRVGPALERRRTAPAVEVVARHVTAVERRDVVAMAADYASDAVLERADQRLVGWADLLDYFETVPPRLGDRALRFADPRPGDDAGTVTVAWRIEEPATGAPVAAGEDTFVVAEGRIVHQRVRLATADF